MSYTELFYWLVVADNARTMFVVFVALFTLIAVISTIAFLMTGDSPEDQAMSRKWMWWSYPIAMIFWSLYIFTPSKKDALLIVAGGQTLNFLTTDESTKQIPAELSSFILTEIKNLAAEAQVDLNIKDQKQKILDEAKNMTSDQLLERIKVDEEFAKIILENK